MARRETDRVSESAAWRELEGVAAQLDLALPSSFMGQARAYLAELDRWTRVGALTGYREPGSRVRHLLTESLLLLSVLPAPASPVVDIGSGVGIPGLVLAWARPEWAVTLVEANRRRANFLRQIVRVLELSTVAVAHGRAEDLTGAAVVGRFRTATMRAVPGGALTQLLARPFLQAEGHLVMTLGPEAPVAGTGRVREVAVRLGGELPWRRRFHILPVTEIGAGVSRGTSRADRAQHGRRQPKGGRRQDDDGRQSGGVAGARGPADPLG